MHCCIVQLKGGIRGRVRLSEALSSKLKARKLFFSCFSIKVFIFDVKPFDTGPLWYRAFSALLDSFNIGDLNCVFCIGALPSASGPSWYRDSVFLTSGHLPSWQWDATCIALHSVPLALRPCPMLPGPLDIGTLQCDFEPFRHQSPAISDSFDIGALLQCESGPLWHRGPDLCFSPLRSP